MKKMTINLEKEAYDKGFRDALYTYAWMKDGTSYVGSGMTTLKHAQENIEKSFNYDGNKYD